MWHFLSVKILKNVIIQNEIITLDPGFQREHRATEI
jgi:hypothetical protein